MAALEPDPGTDLRALRRRLVNAAQHRPPLPGYSAEDLAHEALLRVLERPAKPDDPPLAQRVFRTMRDAAYEIRRRAERRGEPQLVEAPPELPNQMTSDETREIFELDDLVRSHLGDEAVEWIRHKRAGRTDAEIAAQPGWDAHKNARIRKRLHRAAPQIYDDLLDQ